MSTTTEIPPQLQLINECFHSDIIRRREEVKHLKVAG